MASESDGEQQLQTAAAQVMSGAPWQSAGSDSTTESLSQALVEALQDATESVDNMTAAQQNQTVSAAGGAGENALEMLTGLAGGEGVAGAAPATAGGVADSILSGGGDGLDSILSGGSLLSPIIGGIMSLFGSGSSNTPPPLTPFAMSPALDADATGGESTGGQLAGSDYDAYGLPRAQTISNTTAQITSQVNSPSTSQVNSQSTFEANSESTLQTNSPQTYLQSTSQTNSPQTYLQSTSQMNSPSTSQTNSQSTSQKSSQATSNITVQVNAMDSRSFLDRSNDIAAAVRQAILSSHSINDVLSEL